MNKSRPTTPRVLEFSALKDYLQALAAAKAEGRGHSLGRWAKQLGYRSSRSVGMVLRGDRLPTPSMLQSLSRQEAHTLTERRYLSLLVEIEKRRRRGQALEAVADELRELRIENPSTRTLQNAQFAAVACWYAGPLKLLIESHGFAARNASPEEDMRWLHARLGGDVTLTQVRDAIEQLLVLGIVSRDAVTKKLGPASAQHVRSQENIPSTALRSYHREMLGLATRAIESQSVAERYLSGRSFMIRREDYELATRTLYEFLEQFSTRFARDDGTDVYQLETGFFRLCSGKQGDSK